MPWYGLHIPIWNKQIVSQFPKRLVHETLISDMSFMGNNSNSFTKLGPGPILVVLRQQNRCRIQSHPSVYSVRVVWIQARTNDWTMVFQPWSCLTQLRVLKHKPLQKHTSWWFQPTWKISVKWESSPVGGKIKNIWNHHLGPRTTIAMFLTGVLCILDIFNTFQPLQSH